MDLAGAITAHFQWNQRLHRVIDGAETVDVATVAKDDVCPLGRWIHGEARRSLDPAVHDHLRSAHAGFHVVAAEVADAAMSGRSDEARRALAFDGAFVRASSGVIRILDALRTGDARAALAVRVDGPPEAAVAEPPHPGRLGWVGTPAGSRTCTSISAVATMVITPMVSRRTFASIRVKMTRPTGMPSTPPRVNHRTEGRSTWLCSRAHPETVTRPPASTAATTAVCGSKIRANAGTDTSTNPKLVIAWIPAATSSTTKARARSIGPASSMRTGDFHRTLICAGQQTAGADLE